VTALGLQLYTLRHVGEPLPDVLRGVADAGYAGVETVGTQGVEPDRLRDALAAAGLRLASAHVALADLRADRDAVVATHLALGTPLVVVPWLAPADRPDAAAGWADLGRELGDFGATLAEAGLGLAYHHHDFELAAAGDALPGLEHLLAAAEPAHLGLELDSGWLAVAGEDPVAWIDRWGRRVRRLHLKDVALGHDPPWVDLGDGLVDGPAIVAACHRQAVPWCLVEHDAPADPWATVRRSAATARRLLGLG
jgi:sugar phosphate isomerase/epimerase